MLFTAAMMLLMVAEVLSRWILNRAILGSTEWAQVLLCCTMSSFGAAILCNRMTKVDILTSHFKPKTQVILDIFMLFLAAVAIGVLSWRQGAYAVTTYNQHVMFDNIRLPKWIFVAVFSMSYGVAALTTLCVMIRKIVSAVHGEWEKEVKLGDTDWEFAFGKHGVSSWSPDTKPEAAAAAEAPEAEQKEGGEGA
jgi:TRAP-type C4-dicarboxylate transport system permease small subunit